MTITTATITTAAQQEIQEDADVFPLSAQQALILESQNAAGHTLIAGALLAVPDRIDPQAVERAVAALCREHEILRTRYIALPGLKLPVQSILPEPPYVFHHSGDGADPATLLMGARDLIDTASGPLLVGHLLRKPDGSGSLLLAAPLCNLDRRSLTLIAGSLFADRTDDQAEALHYADYAAWQNELRGSDLGRQGDAYWQGLLAGRAGAALLPFERLGLDGRGDDPKRSGTAEVWRDGLPAEASRLAASLDTTADHLMLFLWNAFVCRISGSRDILTGFAVDGRREELDGALGHFARIVPVPATLDPELPLLANWRVFQENLERSLSWQDCLNDRDLYDEQGRPRYAVAFSFAVPDPAEPDFILDRAHATRLHLTCTSHRARARLRLTWPEPTVDPAMPPLWLDQFGTFIDNALAGFELPLERIGLLGAEERRRVLRSFNEPGEAGEAGLSGGVLLHDLFSRQVQAGPDRIAVAIDGKRLSYRDLDRRSNQVANTLLAQGLQPDRIVGVYSGRAVETVIAILGILKAGGAYLPLDPAYPADRLAFMLADAEVRHVVAMEPPADGIPLEAKAEVLSLASGAPVWQAGDHPPPVHAGRDNLAYVIYTSGSTGKPKGVMVSHANAVASTSARNSFYRDKTGQERVGNFLLLSSFSFDSSVAGLFWTLAQGGTLHLPDEQVWRDPERLADVIGKEDITHYLALPSLHAQILERLGPNRLACVIVAGEACPADLTAQHRKALPGVALVNEYGPTEGTVWCTGWPAHLFPDDDTVPIGRPVPGARIYLLDAGLEPVPVGVPGEIHVGGAGIARGYLRRPALTAERFVPDPFTDAPGRRLYRTGDLGRYRPDGSIEFLGRIDQQIKIRGYRVEPGEIEACLRRCAGVRDAVVTARDTPAGKQLAGFIVAEDAAESQSLIARCRSHLAEHLPAHLVPGRLHALDRLPQTSNGKVDRNALAGLDVESRSYVAPRTGLEQALARIWGEALGVERVGVHDNFFELGGHSLLATKLRMRLQNELNVTLPLRLFFEGGTLEQFAAQVEQHRGNGLSDDKLDALESLFTEVETP